MSRRGGPPFPFPPPPPPPPVPPPPPPPVVVRAENVQIQLVQPVDGVNFAEIDFDLVADFRDDEKQIRADLDDEDDEEEDAMDLLQALDDGMNAAFDQVLGRPDLPFPLHPDMRVGIRIGFGGDDAEPFGRWLFLRDRPWNRFFEDLLAHLQSFQEKLFATWHVELRILQVPDGGGRGNLVIREQSIYGKRSVVRIVNRDKLCLWRALAVCEAFEALSRHAAGTPAFARAKRRYDCVRKDRPAQADRAREMHDEVLAFRARLRDSGDHFGLEEGDSGQGTRRGTMTDVVILSRLYERNITVMNLQCQNRVEFRTRDMQGQAVYDHTWYVIRTHVPDGHFHAITNIRAFLSTQYFCEACHTSARSSSQHQCPHRPTCRLCQQPRDAHPTDLSPAVRCERCFRTFTNAVCLEKHRSEICARSWRCPRCHLSYPHSHPVARHVCGETKCHICERFHRERDHACFIQPKQAKDVLASGSVRYYDFEADVSDGHHVPNLAVVSTDGEDFVIYENNGDSVVDKFCEGEIVAANRGCTFVAHNAKRYDTHFIKYWCVHQGVKFTQILQGRKIVVLSLVQLGIRFIDSYNFIPWPLRAFPDTFGLDELAKGTFPYLFNTKANWNYAGEIPPLAMYLPGAPYAPAYVEGEELREFDKKELEDAKNQLLARRHARIRYWKERALDPAPWVMREELIRYCCDDVKVLAKGCDVFRRHFLNATRTSRWAVQDAEETAAMEDDDVEGDDRDDADDEEKGTGVDAFAYTTVASAVMAAYRHQFLEEDTVAFFANYANDRQIRKVAWFSFLEFQDPDTTVLYTPRDSSTPLHVASMVVDGVDVRRRVVYLVLDCVESACPKCFPKRRADTEAVVHKIKRIHAARYDVDILWTCEYFVHLAPSHAFREFRRYHPADWYADLDVHDAFFGGRTNAIQLYRKCRVERGERIRYYDINGLYPYINTTGVYPVAHPRKLFDVWGGDVANGYFFGVAKCYVLPPRGLYHPVLPYRYDGKLLFPLCRTCLREAMVMQGPLECRHTDAERRLMGTWPTPELEYAAASGYRIELVREVHHFERQRKGLFRPFMNPLMKRKQEASGWPGWARTDEQKAAYLRDYEGREGVALDPERIHKNKGMRKTNKLAANSFWGKLAQRANLPQAVVCYDASSFFKVALNPRYELIDVDYAPEKPKTIEVQYRDHWSMASHPPTTNLYLAALTTSQARLQLLKIMHAFGDSVLYVDTDSVVFVENARSRADRGRFASLDVGPFLGQLDDELDGDFIEEWVSTGPKSYAYRTHATQATKLKLKGICFTLHNTSVVNLENMVTLVQGGRIAEKAVNMVFDADKFGTLKTRYITKTFQNTYNKRYIGSHYKTFPYGY